jgi:hypothetical protein
LNSGGGKKEGSEDFLELTGMAHWLEKEGKVRSFRLK